MAVAVSKKILAYHARCRHCQTCMLACSMVHEEGISSLEKARLRVDWELSKCKVRLFICLQCRTPKCTEVDCPVQAIWCDDTGMVNIDGEKCLGCKICQENCPFDAIFYDQERKMCVKCDLCAGRPEGPICVEVCPVDALLLKNGEKK